MNAPTNPEIGLSLRHDTFTTNYHDGGEGEVVLLIHGSGPGVNQHHHFPFTTIVIVGGEGVVTKA